MAAPPPQPHAQPGQQGQQQQAQGPHQRHFQHLGTQVQEDGQRDEAEDGQMAAVGNEMPDSSQHDEPRVRSAKQEWRRRQGARMRPIVTALTGDFVDIGQVSNGGAWRGTARR
ncbi:hypothetical protein D3C72_2066070 [compost metagenome]